MSKPTSEIARLMPNHCHGCGAWEQLGKMRLCHTCHNARYDALEELLEVAGMFRERLPVEVQDAIAKCGTH